MSGSPATGSHVSALWRYPAKSMRGELVDVTAIGPNGVVGDRGWAVRDERRGGIRGAKKIGGLMRLAARYRSEPVPAPPTPTTSTPSCAIFGRTREEPLADLSAFPPEIFEFESPPGTYFDAYPILVVTPCPRCVMITRAFADLPADRDLMRTVVREAGQNIGVYATVRSPGEVRAGAGVELPDTP